MGQKLLVENKKGKIKKIPIGKVMTITTFSDSSNSDPFNYKAQINSDTSYWCLTGCYKFAAIDTISATIQIRRSDSLILTYKIRDVKSINYVRAKRPDRVRARRISLATFGSIILIGRTITIGSDESFSEKLRFYIVGTAMIGYSLLDRRNESRKYKLLGFAN